MKLEEVNKFEKYFSKIIAIFDFLLFQSGNTGTNGQDAVTVFSLCILTNGFQEVIKLEQNFDFKVSPQDF